MKNITFHFDENLIERAREKARREHQSLNKLIGTWLSRWTGDTPHAEHYDHLMDRLQEVCEPGAVFNRDEMNER